jgi:WD40 repeat protein
MITPLDTEHPWPGPDSFRGQDAQFFRGRDAEIAQLLQLVCRAQCVVLYGASGLGKTSLINAGLVPNLPADEYFAVPIRISYVADGPSVSEQLQTEILRSRSGAGMPKPRPGRTAWELLHLREEPIEGAQPLLIFDQFEELFTIGKGTVHAADLIEELKGLIEGGPPACVRDQLTHHPDQARAFAFRRKGPHVLISIREDFLYGLESLHVQLPSLIHNHFRIGPLSGTRALEVVLQRPAATLDEARDGMASGAPLVTPDVAELIVRTVASSVLDDRPLDTLEVEPALLSIMCAELARRRSQGAPITRELVAGSRTDIISSFYERCLHGVPAAVRAYLEDTLVTASGFRTSAVLAEALTVPGFTSEVLSDLVNKRLLRVIERAKGKWIELTHDILTEIAAGSRKARQDRQREQQQRKARADQERVEQLERAARERKRRARARIVLGGLGAIIVALATLNGLQRRLHQAVQKAGEESEAHYEAEQRLHQAAEEAKYALRRQSIEADLREERYREALAQLAAVVREEPNAVWARALLGDLLVRRGWPIPAAPVFPEGPFTGLDCNQSTTRCAAAYRDGNVEVRDVRGGPSRIFSTGQNGFGDVSLSVDDQRLVFVPEHPGTVLQWMLGSPDSKPARLPIEETRNEWWASDDAQVVVLPRKDELVVWQLGGPEPRSRVIKRDLSNAPFRLSRDGAWLAYWKNRKLVELASVDGRESHPIPVDGLVTDVQIDPGSKVLGAVIDGTLRRWSIPDGSKLPPINASRPINGMVFDSTGNRIALELEGGGVALATRPWGEPLVVMPSSHGVMGLSFAPDDRWFAVATRDGTVSAWSTSGSALGEPVRLDGLAFVKALEGRGLLGVSLRGTSARWRLVTPPTPREYVLGEPVLHAWFDSEDVLFAYGESKSLEQVDDARDRATVPLPRSNLHVSRDRRHAATVYTEGLFLRAGIPPETAPKTADDADKVISRASMDAVEFSADGRRLVAAGQGKGYLFDAATGQELRGSPIDGVSAAWLNDDGTILATKGYDVGLKIWRCASDGALTRLADIDTLVVSWVAFNHDSSALVFATENQARIWSLRDRDFIGRTVAHDSPIADVEFSPDGRWIVTGSQDKRARIWEVATGLPASDWFEHPESVTNAAFSPSGKKLLTASFDGQVRVWNLAGTADATAQESRWLARLAEILSGTRIDPESNDAVTEPRPFDGLESLRGQIEQACPGATGEPPGCASATVGLLRALIGERSGDPVLTAAP